MCAHREDLVIKVTKVRIYQASIYNAHSSFVGTYTHRFFFEICGLHYMQNRYRVAKRGAKSINRFCFIRTGNLLQRFIRVLYIQLIQPIQLIMFITEALVCLYIYIYIYMRVCVIYHFLTKFGNAL